jgi:hypothetical protein
MCAYRHLCIYLVPNSMDRGIYEVQSKAESIIAKLGEEAPKILDGVTSYTLPVPRQSTNARSRPGCTSRGCSDDAISVKVQPSSASQSVLLIWRI